MPEIHVTLLGRFAVTVGGAPVAEASWNRRHAPPRPGKAREDVVSGGATLAGRPGILKENLMARTRV
jgi:hypothetical protein